MYIYICIIIYIYIYIFIHIHIYIYIYIYIYMFMFMYMYMYIYKHTYTYIHMCIRYKHIGNAQCTVQPALDQEGHLLASVAAIPGRIQAEVLAIFAFSPR